MRVTYAERKRGFLAETVPRCTLHVRTLHVRPQPSLSPTIRGAAATTVGTRHANHGYAAKPALARLRGAYSASHSIRALRLRKAKESRDRGTGDGPSRTPAQGRPNATQSRTTQKSGSRSCRASVMQKTGSSLRT